MGDQCERQIREDERRARIASESCTWPEDTRNCGICDGEPKMASAIIEHKTRGCIAVCPECHATASEADQISSAHPTVLL